MFRIRQDVFRDEAIGIFSPAFSATTVIPRETGGRITRACHVGGADVTRRPSRWQNGEHQSEDEGGNESHWRQITLRRRFRKLDCLPVTSLRHSGEMVFMGADDRALTRCQNVFQHRLLIRAGNPCIPRHSGHNGVPVLARDHRRHHRLMTAGTMAHVNRMAALQDCQVLPASIGHQLVGNGNPAFYRAPGHETDEYT